jgi:hypothetical protein
MNVSKVIYKSNLSSILTLSTFTSLHLKLNIFGTDFDFWCLNATFSNISAASWRPVLVVEEARVPRETHRPFNLQRREATPYW